MVAVYGRGSGRDGGGGGKIGEVACQPVPTDCEKSRPCSSASRVTLSQPILRSPQNSPRLMLSVQEEIATMPNNCKMYLPGCGSFCAPYCIPRRAPICAFFCGPSKAPL